MSRRYLGEAFDIHGGGIDLRFPHHENEQAQSHGAGWPFASLWVHNAWVTMKGEKMSKSLGNSLVVADILQRVPAPVLRFALGTVHHRSTVDYSEETIHAAAAAWERISGFVQRAGEVAGVTESEVAERAVPQAFADALDNDLNVAGGLAVVYERMKAGNQALADGSEGEVREALLDVRAMLDILGLDPASPQWVSEEGDVSGKDKALDVLVNHLIEQREQARAAKDWSTADSIRDGLAAAGVVVEGGADGARWHIG